MPLKFDTEAAYERWVREREAVEMGSPIGRPGAAARAIRRRVEAPSHIRGTGRDTKALTRRLAAHGRHPVKHVTRPGHRRRAGASLRTLLAPFR